MRRTAAVLTACVAFILSISNVVTTAHAFSVLGYKWSGSNYTYSVNANSFVTNVAIAGLAAGDYQRLVAAAASPWHYRTGSSILFTDNGTTTSTCDVQDSTNVIAAKGTCREPGCFTWALSQPWVSGGTNTVEDDICVYGPSDPWFTQLNAPPAGSKDLIGTLTHEIGHAVGLDHTANTVMDSPTFNTGNTHARYPYGDDVAGMRSLYTPITTRQRYFRETSGTTFGSEVAIGGATPWHVNANVGTGASGSLLVLGTLDPNGTAVHFTRAAFPLGAAPSWTNRFISSSSWRPPSVAGSDYRNLWVAAWAGVSTTLSCSGIQIAVSTDVFDSATTLSLPSDCTMHDPIVAYEGFYDQYLLVYVQRGFGATAATDNHVMVRRSTNGTTWTAAQDLGILAADAADTKCNFWDCMVSATDGGSLPWLQSWAINFNGSGGAVLGSGTTNFTFGHRTTAVGVRNTWSNPSNWWLSLNWTSTLSPVALGQGFDFVVNQNSIPITSYGWTNTNVYSQDRPALAGWTNSSIMELVYVR